MKTGPSYGVDDLARQLAALGVEAGGTLLVHAAFSRMRPVDGGPDGFIDALLAALGPAGTLVMPSMTDDDDTPFDAATTPCAWLGVVADTFRRRPGVRRSDSPHAFAAIGPLAADILAPHPLEIPHGTDSPAGRVHAHDGQVLLAGVGHDANTTVHLAENLAGMRYFRAKHATVLRDGAPVRVDYAELDHCCENFALVDDWLDEPGLQRRGYVGHARARLARSRDIVRCVVARLNVDPTVFLHAPGLCAECDDARATP